MLYEWGKYLFVLYMKFDVVKYGLVLLLELATRFHPPTHQAWRRFLRRRWESALARFRGIVTKVRHRA